MNYYYDIGTTNTSFIEVSKQLENNGIKNSKFMLTLYDISLVGVNPYDPNLTSEIKRKIIEECRLNPFYFLREVIKVKNPDGSIEPFKINRGTLAQTWLFLKGIDSWLTIPRENFSTGNALALIVWVYIFGTYNTNIGIMTCKKESGLSDKYKIQSYIETLPKYMTENIWNDIILKKDSIYFDGMKNDIRFKYTGGLVSEVHAENFSRGLRYPIWYFDDVEFIPYLGTVMEYSTSAFYTAREKSKEMDSLYGRIFTGVPGNMDDESANYANKFISKCIPWNEEYYDYSNDKIKAVFSLYGVVSDVVYIKYQWNEIGRDIDWIEKMAKCIPDIGVFRREILLQRFSNSEIYGHNKDKKYTDELRNLNEEEVNKLIYIIKLLEKDNNLKKN